MKETEGKLQELKGAKGYADYPSRIPPGWKVIQPDHWPINNEEPGEREVFDVSKWRFETCGAVETPLSLTYEEFRKLPHVTKTLDHHCIDGWSYLGQVWTGVELSTITERSSVRKGAKYVHVEGAGGVSQNFPLGQDILLADGQDNGPLTRPAGYPLRVVAPGQFGSRSIKWVRRLKFCEEWEPDSREKKYARMGLSDLYAKEIAERDPWTVNNDARKAFLRGLFTYNTDVRRKKKQAEYLENVGKEENDSRDIALCKLEELEDGKPLKRVVNGCEVLLIKSGDRIYAVEPLCTHHGSDLSRGKVNVAARTISCPLHGACFDLATGSCLAGSYGSDGGAFPGVRTYHVKVESGIVLAEREQAWGRL
ncbi:MAG TPA: molybdopterin-dependent oxidoreductase [Nitrososphaerales archaeon]|nr:molybdopterin-dependent oxidoreductase [Nitrososphaerales archaeon]